MANNKYEFTDETVTTNDGRTLHRIKALKDFRIVNTGELGGFIETEKNLDPDGDAWVSGDAWVYGDAWVSGDAWVYGDADIKTKNDILILSFLGSRLDTTTFFRAKNNEILVKCGCFTGPIDQFLKQVEKTHGTNKYGDEYRLAAQLAELHIHDEKREDK